MLPFMFEVLGSVVFWIFYGTVTVIATGTMIKHLTPTAWQILVTGEKQRAKDVEGDLRTYADGWLIWVIMWFLILWPVILIGILFYFIIIKIMILRIMMPLIRQLLIKSSNIIPEFTTKEKEED